MSATPSSISMSVAPSPRPQSQTAEEKSKKKRNEKSDFNNNNRQERFHSALSDYLTKLEAKTEQEEKVEELKDDKGEMTKEDINAMLAASYRAPKNTSAKTIFGSDFSFIGKASLPAKKQKAKKKNAEKGEKEQVEEEAIKDNKPLRVNVYAVRMSRLSSHTRKMKNLLKKEFGVRRLHDLIHGTCAMYNLCLPDIEPHHIYNCVCSRKSVTICVLKDNSSLLADDLKEEETKKEEKDDDEEDKDTVYGSKDNLELFLEDNNKGEEENKSLFRGLFSDYEDNDDEEEEEDESDDEDEEETDDDDNFTIGLKSFVEKDKKSKEKSELLKNLVACATLERVSTFQQPNRDEWVIDLELMGVRRAYRGHGLGKYLIGLAQSERVVGAYDALVTSSDPDAVEFYEKYAFLADPILNSKYSHIGDLWTNTTKMCYLPPYSMNNENKENKDSDEKGEEDYINELTLMERDFKRWQKIMFSAYQTQAQIFYKFKQEIMTLKAKMCAKSSLIEELKMRNDMLARKNRLLRLQQRQQNDNNDLNDDDEDD